MPNQWFSKSLIRSRSNMKTNSKIEGGGQEKHNLDTYTYKITTTSSLSLYKYVYGMLL